MDSRPNRMLEQRRQMVAQQVAARGVRSTLVLQAMIAVPREDYVPADLKEFAYHDTALPIEEKQSVSQPFIVARMIEALQLSGGERVLEVGTGSGYAAAVLAEIAGEVYTMERRPQLAASAAARLAIQGCENVNVRCGDGTLGWPEEAPFDGIIVAAGGPAVPPTLREQLATRGRLVIPIGKCTEMQALERITRSGADSYRTERLAHVRFVPLIGREGWKDEVVGPPGQLSPGADPPGGQMTGPDSIADDPVGGEDVRV